MAHNIKPYNYTYRVAMRFLKENREADLNNVYLWTIHHLDKKHNFSKEGVKRAWNDFKKIKNQGTWPEGNLIIKNFNQHNDFIDQIDANLFDRVFKNIGPKLRPPKVIIDDLIK